MRCDKCGWYRPKHAVCEFDDTLTEPYEICLNWKPITNADRIRAMTNEELTDFLIGVGDGNTPEKIVISVRDTRFEEKMWLDWLKQEIE